ncbi:MAG: acetyl-CoA carboxylase carboxyltransferase subunit alpha [Trueperaceae bacterium]|nr:acetyl-CoA carboxylase carboxyltransferase subunit alpha [Trueperaceae bacterium]
MSLPFEKPIDDLEAKITDMRSYAEEQGIDLSEEIGLLERRLEQLKRDTFANITRWQRVQVARIAGRPTGLDYVANVFTDFEELHGDRTLGDDPALVTGLARLGEQTVIVMAQQKGRDTKENILRNFGMMHPSGYRKAMRMFDLADKFRLPIIAMVDTPGAYPGLSAEEQGQAWVISECIQRMSRLKVPAISLVIGEGGSGGALAIAVANRVLILENAIYSVISPESCAAIRWRDSSEAPQAAEALKLTAYDLLDLNVVDRVIDEPLGGAHKEVDATMAIVKSVLLQELGDLLKLDEVSLLEQRRARFRALGRFEEVLEAA